MEFKIDTKPGYTIITPVSNVIDANLTEAIRQKWKELLDSGSQNLIIDMQNFISAEEAGIRNLEALHLSFYETNHSLVFTEFQEEVATAMKATGADERLNMAPTLAEAVDIVSMEILERDLFNEES